MSNPRKRKRGDSRPMPYNPSPAWQFNTRRSEARVYPRQSSETKYFDTAIYATVTWAGTTWASSHVPCTNYVDSGGNPAVYTDSCLIPTAIGSGYGQVNGNRYNLKKISVRGTIELPPKGGVTNVLMNPANVRLLLVMDQQPNGAQATGDLIMQDIGTTSENLQSFQRVSASSGRFRILKDKKASLQPLSSVHDGTNYWTAHSGYKFNISHKFASPLRVNIASGNATPAIGGVVSHNIFLLAVCELNNTATSCIVTAASRAYYCE